MNEAKKSKKKKASGVWYLIGSLALAVGMFAIMPKVISAGSNYIFDKTYNPED